MPIYNITHNHSAENCFGAPNRDDEMSSLWEQIGNNAEENNVDIKFFKKTTRSQHSEPVSTSNEYLLNK